MPGCIIGQTYFWKFSNRVSGETFMFIFYFSHNKTVKTVLFTVFAAAFILAATACQQPDSEDASSPNVIALTDSDSIIGTWTSTWSENYIFTSKDFTNKYGSSETYTGTTPYVYKISGTSGIVYFKYVKAYCSTHSDTSTNTYVYDTDAADAGKWYAVYYSDLTTTGSTTTAKISAAYGTVSSTETLEEAVKTFTVDNKYFSASSVCTKQ